MSLRFFQQVIPRLVSMIMSWLDAGNLRTQVYELKEKVELVKVALDDINRIQDIELIKGIAQRTLEKM